MASEKNRFGLNRHIPDPIAREVRRRCGFGCVICGSAIYDYEHFSPEFKDARTHDADKIALLCPTDHRRKVSGLLSEEEYFWRIRNPIALETGFSHAAAWSSHSFTPEIVIGSVTFAGGTSVLRIGDNLFLGFDPPEETGNPPRLNYRICDRRGVVAFSIVDNEIQCHNEAFDIEAIGNRWNVRSAKRKIDLEVRFEPPTRITIERLHFRYLKWEFIVDDRTCSLLYNGSPSMIGFSGIVRVIGSCLYSLEEHEPSAKMQDLSIEFGALPSPIGTIPTTNGFKCEHFYYLRECESIKPYIMLFDNRKTLPIYARKSFAQKACPDGFEPIEISNQDLLSLIETAGYRHLCEVIAFNPNFEKFAWIRNWQNFVKEMRLGFRI